MHVLIPFAAPPEEVADAALDSLRLPHLEQLLASLKPSQEQSAGPHDYTPLHERIVAGAVGLPLRDGGVPWAAWELGATGAPATEPVAWMTPCHWRAHTQGFSMADPADLALSGAEHQALADALAPYLAQDGLQLTTHTSGRWLVRGGLLGELRCASLDRVIGRQIEPWLPQGAAALTLLRLQGEIQMLLHDHPLNDERAARGLLSVNAVWLHGAGCLSREGPGTDTPPRVWDGLRATALRADWVAWRHAWSSLDRELIAPLQRSVAAGDPLTLTLCGERLARSYQRKDQRWWQRWPRQAHPKAAEFLRKL